LTDLNEFDANSDQSKSQSLLALEKQQDGAQTKTAIHSANTIEEQQRIMEEIQKSKNK